MLSPAQQRTLAAIAAGQALKVHRDLEGRKLYQLHTPDGVVQPVRATTVQALVARGLIDSNKKFPVATFWLTPAGRAALARRQRG